MVVSRRFGCVYDVHTAITLVSGINLLNAKTQDPPRSALSRYYTLPGCTDPTWPESALMVNILSTSGFPSPQDVGHDTQRAIVSIF